MLFTATSGLAHADEPAPDPRPTPATEAFVHIDAAVPVALRRHVGRFGEVVCHAPCDQTIRFDPKDPFSVEGSFPSPSGYLSFTSLGPRIDMRVDAGNKAGIVGGAITTGVGGATLLVTGFTLAFIIFADAFGGGDGIDPKLRNNFFIAMASSAALLPIGIPILVLSGTKVEVQKSKTASRGLLAIHF